MSTSTPLGLKQSEVISNIDELITSVRQEWNRALPPHFEMERLLDEYLWSSYKVDRIKDMTIEQCHDFNEKWPGLRDEILNKIRSRFGKELPVGPVDLLQEALEFIGNVANLVESEHGDSRGVEDMDKEGAMPEIYYKIKKYLEEVK